MQLRKANLCNFRVAAARTGQDDTLQVKFGALRLSLLVVAFRQSEIHFTKPLAQSVGRLLDEGRIIFDVGDDRERFLAFRKFDVVAN